MFLPGFKEVDEVAAKMSDPIGAYIDAPDLQFVDHVVGNQPEHEMEPTA